MTKTTVFNLFTGEESCFKNTDPKEALITAAIIDAGEPELISNPLTRKRYAKKIIAGKFSIGIDNVAVQIR